ncbi:MAG: hypothetical protein AAF225_09290 [Pseudomonadota bacterium]
MIDRLCRDQTTKYNLKGDMPSLQTNGRDVLLVPGQVEDDASIRVSHGDVKTNRDLLLAARRDYPDAFLVYKPHPDVEVAGRPGHVPDAEDLSDLVIQGVSASAAIAAADRIATITSLLGFEALLRNKPVRVYGSPFYAGWGLTDDAVTFERRGRPCSLEELVVAALIEAPLYISPLTDVPCGPEDTVEALFIAPSRETRIMGAKSLLRTWRRLKRYNDRRRMNGAK